MQKDFMDTASETTALVQLTIGLSATPEIRFIRPSGIPKPVPAPKNSVNGFSVAVEVALPYTSLTTVLQTCLQGKRFSLSEGLISQHVEVDDCKLHSAGNLLLVEAAFSGSYRGTIYFKGTPVYNQAGQRIELTPFDYDIETKNLLLKGAKWLFDKIILEEMKKRTVFELAPVYKAASLKITEALNRQWAKGINAEGSVDEIALTTIEVQATQLLLHLQCRGRLQLAVSELIFNF